MHRSISRKLVALAVPLAVLGTLTMAPADEAASGPSYPPPGGVTWNGTGDMGRAGGAVWDYADLDMSLFLNLWWGPAGADALNVSLDGEIDEPGETLAFSAADSDLEAGVAQWNGESDMSLAGGGSVMVPIRFVVTADGPMDFEAAAGIEGPGALVPVSGPYSLGIALEGYYAGSWQPLLDMYDAVHQAPGAPGVITDIAGGFYYHLNQAPEASITTDPTPPVAERTTTLDANATDADGSVALVEWDADNDGLFDDGTGDSIDVVFPAKGTYTVRVRVTDDRGLSAIVSADIEVVRCDEGPVSGTVHSTVEPLAGGEGGTVHDLNCATIAELGL